MQRHPAFNKTEIISHIAKPVDSAPPLHPAFSKPAPAPGRTIHPSFNKTDTGSAAKPVHPAFNKGATSPPAVQQAQQVQQVVPVQEEEYMDREIAEIMGHNLLLPTKYVVWYHDITNRDWSIDSYARIYEITTVSQFWRFLNNLTKIGCMSRQYFLMKGDIEPLWEHPSNRNGGLCSFKIDSQVANQVFETLCAYMVTDNLSKNVDDITGISISPKNAWAILKVWNGDCNNDLTQTLNTDILENFSHYSIKYQPSKPEY
jgi:hypothetical protein